MVQVEFLKIKNQVNKRVNSNSNLPRVKNKNNCSDYLVFKRTISNFFWTILQ